ncbi:hypothetical protein CF326_g395 [Tilletia indica]|nr:hypothetical protein CF326_g395 [Tilletia indica]
MEEIEAEVHFGSGEEDRSQDRCALSWSPSNLELILIKQRLNESRHPHIRTSRLAQPTRIIAEDPALALVPPRVYAISNGVADVGAGGGSGRLGRGRA